MNRRLQTERNRAETAYKCAKEGVQEYGKKPLEQQTNGEEECDENYKSIIAKLPAQILNNGLGATVAFHFSKSKNKKGKVTAHGYVCGQLREWLVMQHYVQSNDLEAFAHDVVALPTTDSRAVTNEALAFLTWLRRFTDGLSGLKQEENDNNRFNESTGES